MTEVNHMQMPPQPRELDIPTIVTHTVDQVVIDGEVDGLQRRVLHRRLVRIAFQGIRASDAEFHDFNDALTDEERYLDRVGSKYGYQPVLSEGSTVQPNMTAIVDGRAMCTEEERAKVMADMDALAEKVFQYCNKGGVLSLREISGTLKSAGRGQLTYAEFGAFMTYMRNDERFDYREDGRVFLLGNEGSEPAPERLDSITDFAELIDMALPNIWTREDKVFSDGALLGTLKAHGVYVRMDQLQELYEHLRVHPNVQITEKGKYRIVGDVESSSTRPLEAEEIREVSTLEAMISGALYGGDNRKPRSKRHGGWKRVAEM